MDIEILYVAGCPNVEPARQAVDAALAQLRVAASVRLTPVAEDAGAATGMRGSPTVLVDGVDAVASDEPAGSLSCRLYRTDSGLQGAPPVPQLVEAFRRASAG